MRKHLFLMVLGVFIGGVLSAQVPDNWLPVYRGENTNENPGNNVLYIAGWSNDGKVALYEEETHMYSNRWIIMDTKTDEILVQEELWSSPVDYEKLKEQMAQFGVTHYTGSLIMESDIGLTMEYREIPGSEEGWWKEVEVWAVKDNAEKQISTTKFFIAPYMPIERTYLIESPFENRVLIISCIDERHAEFDYRIRNFSYAGCHLEYGF